MSNYSTNDGKITLTKTGNEQIQWKPGDVMMLTRNRAAMLVRLVANNDHWSVIDLATGRSICTGKPNSVITWLNDTGYQRNTRIAEADVRISITDGQR
jgi:hypothetical protein